jgi:hypothetical protein
MRPTKKRTLNRHDSLHIKAAQCWLALGNLEEANREMESVHPRNRRHPDVQDAWAQIEAATRYVRTIVSNDRILQPHWDSAEFEYEPECVND